MAASVHECNIIIDLEFTPLPGDLRVGKLRNEIIEIGAVRCDARGNAIGTFSTLVQPQIAEHVTHTVSSLTGITTSDVVDAPTFGEALGQLVNWIGDCKTTRIVAWSKSDERQLRTECAAKGINIPCELSCWLDLQVVYPRLMGIGKRRGMMALKDALEWSGTRMDPDSAHRALYDAQCTAELFRSLASGDYIEQRKTMTRFVPRYRRSESEKDNSMGIMAGALSGLYQQMMAQCA